MSQDINNPNDNQEVTALITISSSIQKDFKLSSDAPSVVGINSNVILAQKRNIPPDNIFLRDSNESCSKKRQRIVDNQPILFYEAGKPYEEFSNFFTDKHFKLIINGISFASSEHAYQSAKYDDVLNTSPHQKMYASLIAKAKTPAQCFYLGRQLAPQKWEWGRKLQENIIDKYKSKGVAVRCDWSTVKDSIMLNILESKFKQNPRLMKLLVSTGVRKLVEHTQRDSYWGDGGGNGRGQNKLGIMLMLIRDQSMDIIT
jgi:ribA/ribD-fused uncharacterized protein